MAMIKCPECGQRISSMAGTCPHCGVAIKGHLRECPECGEYMLDVQNECPECGATVTPLAQTRASQSNMSRSEISENGESQQATPETEGEEKKKKTNVGLYVTLFLLFFFGVGGGWAFYEYQQKAEEEKAYEDVMETTNPEFYQLFLDRYPNSTYAPEVKEKMQELTNQIQQWQSVSTSTDVTELQRFADSNPDSPFRNACLERIDSLDWETASSSDSEVAIEEYIQKHPEGRYVDQASERRNTLAREKLSDTDVTIIRSNVESLLSSMAQNSLSGIESVIASAKGATSVNFRGDTESKAEDILAWCQKKVESDVIGIHYQIEGEPVVEKKADGQSILYVIKCAVKETINRSDPTKESSATYQLKAKLNADKKIIELYL